MYFTYQGPVCARPQHQEPQLSGQHAQGHGHMMVGLARVPHQQGCRGLGEAVFCQPSLALGMHTDDCNRIESGQGGAKEAGRKP